MTFESGKSLVASVKEYALQTKKEVRVDAKSKGSKTRVILCTEEICPFKIVAYKSSSAKAGDKPWYISSAVLEHRDCSSEPKLTSRQLANLTSLRSAVASNPSVSRDFLMQQIQSVHSLNVERQRRTLYKAKQIVVKELERDELESYRLIPDYLKKLEELNPGTVTRFNLNAKGEFKCCMIVCGPSVKAQNGMQVILGVDGAHCRHRLYNGKQLVLLGRDGNMRNVRIATALVPSENEEDYVWFFSTCLGAGVNLSVPVMSDRNSGLIAAARSLSIDLHYYTLHILQNIRSQYSSLDDAGENNVWNIQEAIEEAKFKSELFRLEYTSGKGVREYVEKLDPAKWAVYPNAKEKKLYGLRTTNFVESRVVLFKKECSCGYISQHGIPCRHLIAALRHMKLSQTAINFFGDIYKVQTYDAAFGAKFFLPPLVHELVQTDVLPSTPPAPRPGRTRKNRIASTGEKRSTMTKTYRKRCSKCRGYGHMSNVCPSHTLADLSDDEDAFDFSIVVVVDGELCYCGAAATRSLYRANVNVFMVLA